MKLKPELLIYLSVIAIVVAAVVSIGKIDIWLAGTQWALVSILLAIYAIYLKISGK